MTFKQEMFVFLVHLATMVIFGFMLHMDYEEMTIYVPILRSLVWSFENCMMLVMCPELRFSLLATGS